MASAIVGTRHPGDGRGSPAVPNIQRRSPTAPKGIPMHAWLLRNPGRRRRAALARPAHPRTGRRRGAHRHQGGEPELPRHADRARQVPVQAPLPFVPGAEFAGVVEPWAKASPTAPACRWPRIGGTGGFGTHAIVQRRARVLPLPPGFELEDGAAFAFTYGTSHHALIDRGAAEGRRDRAGAGRRRRRGHGRGADRQGGRRARDRRRLHRRKVRAVPRWAPTPRSTTARRTCATRSRR
jgi:hypothetical protein